MPVNFLSSGKLKIVPLCRLQSNFVQSIYVHDQKRRLFISTASKFFFELRIERPESQGKRNRLRFATIYAQCSLVVAAAISVVEHFSKR